MTQVVPKFDLLVFFNQKFYELFLVVSADLGPELDLDVGIQPL